MERAASLAALPDPEMAAVPCITRRGYLQHSLAHLIRAGEACPGSDPIPTFTGSDLDT